jgi:hypothetical protein
MYKDLFDTPLMPEAISFWLLSSASWAENTADMIGLIKEFDQISAH